MYQCQALLASPSLADPIIDSVNKVIHRDDVDHKAISEQIKKHIETTSDTSCLLELSRSLFRSRCLSGEVVSEPSEISLISDRIGISIEFYHERDYDNSIKMGLLALEDQPNNLEARGYLVRSYAQVGNFAEARHNIDFIRGLGALRDVYFLTGFVERLAGNIPDAISAYESALLRGRKGVAIHRELAKCYLHNGDMTKTRFHIEKAQEVERNNRYVTDLLVIISIRQGDIESARKNLAILEKLDKPEFYHHRASTVEYADSNYDLVYEESKRVMDSTNKPTFAMLSQMIKVEIATERLEDALKHIKNLILGLNMFEQI